MNFRFTQEHLDFFLSNQFGPIESALTSLREKYSDPLTLQTRLRAKFPGLPPSLAAATLALIDVRSRAAAKLALHPASLLTGEALEQASSMHAAAFHATLFAGFRHVGEICAGIGSDTAVLSARVERVSAVEADPVVARMLGHNMRLLERDNVTVACTTAEDWLAAGGAASCDALWADPSRRIAGRRVIAGADYSPTLDTLARAARSLPVAVKIAPAAEVTDPLWRKIFLAVRDECSEQILLAGFDRPPVSVVVAESGAMWAPDPDAEGIDIGRPESPAFLIEPHNAVVRAGLVRPLLAALGAAPIDPRIAYGIARDAPPPGALHRTFRIIDTMPFNLGRLRIRLRELGWSRATEIKKRGFPLLPDELRRKIAWHGDTRGVLICTRQDDRHVVFLCERVAR